MAQKRTARRAEPADDEADVPLQAVLLADSFAQQFRPITDERPKVLLPLVNVPMIDYALEWLASAGVAEVFVFCCAHAKQVTSYLEHSNWSSQPNFTLTTIESRDCVSAGDALRVIDQRNVIRGDFVLLTGDTVCNMSLKEVLKEHQDRSKKDKMSVMTMVIRRSKPLPLLHQTRLGNEELLLVIDPSSKQLLHYDTLKEASGSGTARQQSLARQVVLERSLLEDRPAVQLRADIQGEHTDLTRALTRVVPAGMLDSFLLKQTSSRSQTLLFECQDCHIDICSPEVLALLTDNFDYQHLRRDFVKGLLSDEVMGNKIYTFEIYGHYAARVDNLRAYDVISKDIIQRWTYPMVPDIRFASPGKGIKVGRRNLYTEDGIFVAQTASIGPSTVIGTATTIGEKSIIRNSVIGRGCTIGKNVLIEGSHVWNNVTIGDNAQIQSAVICDGAVVKSRAILEPGVVLSFKVIIGENFAVPAYSKVSLIRQSPEDDSSDEELEYGEGDRGDVAESPPSPFHDGEVVNGSPGHLSVEHPEGPSWDSSEVGVGGIGSKWSSGQEEEWRHSVAPIPKEKILEVAAREEEGELEDATEDLMVLPSNDKAAELGVDEEEADEEDEDSFFQREVEDTFRRAVTGESGAQEDHVVLEVNALKLADNRSFSDIAGAMFSAFLNLAFEKPHTNSKELLQNTKQVVSDWGSLLRRFLHHQDDEMEVLLKFEEICLSDNKEFAPIFSLILQELYDKEIITEDAILSWASEKEGGDEVDKLFVKQCEKFIQWLQTAEEDDSDDDT